MYLPIASRKQIRIVAIPSPGFGAGSLKIRGFMNSVKTAALPVETIPQEFSLAPDLALAGGVVATTQFSDPDAQYLGLLTAGGVAGQTLEVAVEAQD